MAPVSTAKLQQHAWLGLHELGNVVCIAFDQVVVCCTNGGKLLAAEQHSPVATGSIQQHYDCTLNTSSCSRECSTTFNPKSSFGPTSVTGA